MKWKIVKKNSRSSFFLNMAGGWAVMILFISFIFFPGRLHAQMFSVGEDRTQFNIPLTSFYLGLEPVSVDYFGDDPSPEAGGFEFEGSLLRLRYETTGLNLFLATGGAITGIDDQSYFDVGGSVEFGLPVYRNQKIFIQIPLELKSIYTTMTNSQFIGSATSFRFGSLLGGVGVKLMARVQDDVRFEINGLPSYGLTFASGGFFGGSLGILSGGARAYFDRIFGDVGLTFGYDYKHRKYDVDEPLYDYKIRSHSILIGITF